MKHFSVSGNTLAVCSDNLRRKLLLVLFFLAWLGQHALLAQCNMMSTNPDPLLPKMFKLDTVCEVKIKAVDLLSAPGNCPGSKNMIIRDGMSNVVAFGLDSLTVDATNYVNQLLSVTVTDTTTTLFSVTYIALIDDKAPVIDCQNIDMSCIDEATIVIVELPAVTDNCDPEVNLEYHDVMLGSMCERVIERTWTATDKSGNESTCVQLITVTRPPLDSIVFPKDTILNCGTADTAAIALGRPMLRDQVVTTGAICNISASRVDSVKTNCGDKAFTIRRFWTVTDNCTGEMKRDTQLITVQDTLAPEIEIQEIYTVPADPGQCYGTVTLPEPELLDNCDASPRLFVSTSYGATGLGPHPFVPVGPHTVQYTAVDACGNTRVFKMQLNVIDDEAPSAVCEGYTAVGLPSVGIVTVPAKTFNKGSRDNCAPKLYFKVRKVTTGTCDGINGDDSPLEGYQEWFDDDVTFCCAEAGPKFVKLIFRVYEIDPGPGPVNPERELPGGDLYNHYNECMIDVEVQDKIAPIIKCPANVTVNCTENLHDLSRFGRPEVVEFCGYTLDSTVVKKLNECNTGTIERIFTATDNFGNKSTCTQIITVVNPTPLKAEDIQWPQMYVSNECGTGTDPEDLPEGFARPIITNTSCNFFAVSHSDQFFDVAFPACYKIIRTWEVIDWCKYEPQYPERGGKFSSTQIIKVEDIEAPVMNCPPAEITVSTGNSCGVVPVTIPTVTGQDCSPNIIITNDSPYATNGGANASGNYPVGTTVVTFTAKDRCGNTSTCKVKVIVQDKTKPSPVCIVGLSMNLVNKDGEFVAIVNAKSFNGGSFDNCTPKEKLKFALRRPGNTPAPPVDTMLTFTCGDVGNQVVEFWVTDEQGNSDYCVTFISIQDNNRLCPAPSTGMIAGGIETERGDWVENVHVRVNSNAFQVMTGQTGGFEFPYLPIGHDYTIVPEKNDDLKNGVSTIDVLLIARHILGIQKLNSPYKIIAADVDRSGDVSVLDMVRLRKVILGVDDKFPNGNKSWRFVKSDFNFPDPQNPFKTTFPELYNVNDFDGQLMDADFKAVKVGDVDFSARANNAVNIESRVSKKAFALNIQDKLLKADETFTLELTAQEAAELMGYQFALQYDPDLLEFVTLDNGSLPNMSDANFGLHLIDEGVVTTSWNIAGDETLSGKAALFTLTLRARSSVKLSEVLSLSPRYLNSEAYNTDEEIMEIKLEFSEPVLEVPINATPVENSFELYQNAPNPFATQTVVPFQLPETTYAKLTIFDATGRVVYSREGEFPQGYNEVIINRSEVNAEGMLYYRLETLGRHQTKKMILLD